MLIEHAWKLLTRQVHIESDSFKREVSLGNVAYWKLAYEILVESIFPRSISLRNFAEGFLSADWPYEDLLLHYPFAMYADFQERDDAMGMFFFQVFVKGLLQFMFYLVPMQYLEMGGF